MILSEFLKYSRCCTEGKWCILNCYHRKAPLRLSCWSLVIHPATQSAIKHYRKLGRISAVLWQKAHHAPLGDLMTPFKQNYHLHFQ